MSGVEIAGLALAVLPILIAAADSLKKQRLDARREELLVNLAYETTLLHMHLERLASSLPGLPDELRSKLLSTNATQNMEDSWSSNLVVDTLKSYLGLWHEPFIHTLATILDCLEKLLEQHSLGLSGDEAVCARILLSCHDDTEINTGSTFSNVRKTSNDQGQENVDA